MISIVTPVFNGENHIGPTLDCLSTQKANFEHVVMDALSKDQTRKVAESYAGKYNIRVVSQADEGFYDAIQNGFAMTKGDIMGWINAGDLYMPWTLSVVEKVFELYPDIDWITGIPALYYELSNLCQIEMTVPVYSQYCIRKGWHNGRWLPFIQQESTFWRRSLWERSNGADLLRGQGRGKGYAQDYQLWKRFAHFARLRTVCSMLAAFTITAGQISDRLRAQYFKEAGVDKVYALPNRWTRSLFRLYSFSQLALKSQAVSNNTVSSEFPIRVV